MPRGLSYTTKKSHIGNKWGTPSTTGQTSSNIRAVRRSAQHLASHRYFDNTKVETATFLNVITNLILTFSTNNTWYQYFITLSNYIQKLIIKLILSSYHSVGSINVTSVGIGSIDIIYKVTVGSQDHLDIVVSEIQSFSLDSYNVISLLIKYTNYYSGTSFVRSDITNYDYSSSYTILGGTGSFENTVVITSWEGVSGTLFDALYTATASDFASIWKLAWSSFWAALATSSPTLYTWTGSASDISVLSYNITDTGTDDEDGYDIYDIECTWGWDEISYGGGYTDVTLAAQFASTFKRTNVSLSSATNITLSITDYISFLISSIKTITGSSYDVSDSGTITTVVVSSVSPISEPESISETEPEPEPEPEP